MYLNPELDAAAIRGQYQRDGHLLVRDFFQPHVAEALAAHVKALDWGLAIRGQSGDQHFTPQELRTLDAQTRQAHSIAIQQQAEKGFGYSFLNHRMVETAEQGHDDLLSRFVRWMATPECLSAIEAMTGETPLNRVYAMATMYQRGSFLTAHDDHTDNERRRLAYVLNLTPKWRAHWGGLLQFTDAAGDVTASFVPHFNSVALFKVPQDHHVSYVAPYAMGSRIAITGWFITA